MTQKIIGLFGIFIFLFIAWLCSSHKKSMGHSSIQVTLDKYGHLMPELYEIGGNAMNDVILNY